VKAFKRKWLCNNWYI